MLTPGADMPATATRGQETGPLLCCCLPTTADDLQVCCVESTGDDKRTVQVQYTPSFLLEMATHCMLHASLCCWHTLRMQQVTLLMSTGLLLSC